MSIKRKLTVTMMGISVGSVIITVAAITAYLIYDMQKTKLEELQVTATLTADRNAAALLFLDNERATKNLELFHLNDSIRTACVYEERGNLFAAYSAVETESAQCPPQYLLVPEQLKDALVAKQPIIQGAETIGYMYIAANTKTIDAYIEKIMMISGTTAMLVLLGAFIATMIFQRSISGPITKLTDIAHKITNSRDYSLRAPENFTDETATLARVFNNMISEIRARDQELSDSNLTLEHKVLERTQELETAMHKAEQASEAKTEFLRNMSHEFRTPLHALVSFTSYGIKEYETADRSQLKQYFEIMQTGANRLAKLVNEVLDLAKMEQGEHLFTLTRESLGELSHKAVALVQPLLKEKNLTLNISDPKEVTAVCDHDKLIQVITNLLSNAIKFTPQGKSITLHIQHQGDADSPEVALSVIDEGVGIPDGEKEKIFESFHQSSRTNTGAGGTGLGLAICRRIIEAHGGRIWADNNAELGARVTFVIPANQEEGARKVVYAA